MSDDLARVERVMKDADHPADATQESPLTPDTPPDRTRQFTHTSFARMRRNWLADDALMLAQLKAQVEEVVKDRFKVAIAITAEIYKIVREPMTGPGGEKLVWPDGSTRWQENTLGVPVENWSKLGRVERENLLHAIAVHEAEWSAASADIWAEAMYAKVQWEVTFASGFSNVPSSQTSGRPTIDDKTQWGHRYSSQERYFAVYCAHLSRRADALVRSMEHLRMTLAKTAFD